MYDARLVAVRRAVLRALCQLCGSGQLVAAEVPRGVGGGKGGKGAAAKGRRPEGIVAGEIWHALRYVCWGTALHFSTGAVWQPACGLVTLPMLDATEIARFNSLKTKRSRGVLPPSAFTV